MFSHDIQYMDLKKSCIHATYHKSRHYLTLMTDYGYGRGCFKVCTFSLDNGMKMTESEMHPFQAVYESVL